jgi:hypothetical protein
MVNSCSRARAISASRLAAESVYPAGFWKLGMMWAIFGVAPVPISASSAATSMPSASSSTARTSAPRPRSDRSVRSYVGRSTTTVSPDDTRASKRKASACIEPLVTITREGSTSWRSAIHSRSGG